MSALKKVKYIYYFTDELFYKRYVFWFIEGTDNSRPGDSDIGTNNHKD
jgi:hypothetical protein